LRLKHYLALLKIFIRQEWSGDCAEVLNKKPSAMGFYTPLEGLFLGKTMNRHSSLADIQFCVKPQFSPSMIAAIWRRAPPTVMHR
jgi:hypothetical protein